MNGTSNLPNFVGTSCRQMRPSLDRHRHRCPAAVARRRAGQWHFLPAALLTLGTFLAGCVSDSTLLEENARIALRSARIQARKDLQCPQLAETIESEQLVSGAPWGHFYSDYDIRAEGCGRSANYRVQCRNERLCRVTRQTQ